MLQFDRLYAASLGYDKDPELPVCIPDGPMEEDGEEIDHWIYDMLINMFGICPLVFCEMLCTMLFCKCFLPVAIVPPSLTLSLTLIFVFPKKRKVPVTEYWWYQENRAQENRF